MFTPFKSILERLERPTEITFDWLAMDRSERGWKRKEASIRYGMKHKKPQNPLAPVEQLEGFKPRAWKWLGETIEGKLVKGELCTKEEILKEGFKLPKLKKKGKI